MHNEETWERKRQSDEEASARYGNPYVCEVRGGWWRSCWMMPNLQWCHESFRTEAQARAHSATKHNPRRLGPRSAWTDVASPPEVSGSKFEWRHLSAPVLVKDAVGRVCVGQYAVDPDGEAPPRWIEDGRDGYEIDRPVSWHMIPGDDSS